MSERIVTVGGRSRAVHVSGVEGALGVLLFPGGPADAAGYEEVVARLENSNLLSYMILDIEGLDEAGVIEVLDELGLSWVHLAGSGAGADLAWQVASRHFDRVSSLVVVDRGHPAAADGSGLIEDAGCPAVEVSTTLILTSDEHRPRAYGTGRHAYSDYRVVELPVSTVGAKGVATDSSVVEGALATALATEIILRSNPW